MLFIATGKMISLTILVENTARGTGVIGEHGLSYWLETGTHRVLFDTGQGIALFHNAPVLGIDLSHTDAIVLSHGHYDHTGELEGVLAVADRAPLFLHPEATHAKFIATPAGKSRRLSTRFMEDEGFRSFARKVVAQREPCEVVPCVWMTGEIPRETSFEDTGGPFFVDEGLQTPDPLHDDQALYINTKDGLLVILGCAHSGVINILRHIRKLTHGTPIHTIIGGLHLESASPERMNQTIAALKSLEPERLGFCHCTGLAATVRLWNEFPGRCFQAHAGLRLDFAETR